MKRTWKFKVLIRSCFFFLFLVNLVENRINYNPDTHLPTPQLLVKYGYPVETHTVLTEDGYFLTLHRIPYGQHKSTRPRYPVMLQHGLLCSSADWIILGPGKSLAYVLADEGYDVWIGNARGNTYSRKHLNYTAANGKFWDYSFHEMGIYDLPVVTDYILKTTGHKCLKYVGHSMGITMFLVLLSEHPEYNDKFCLMVGLAPVAYISHAPTPIRDFSVTNGMEGVLRTLASVGIHDLLRNSDFTVDIAKSLCKEIVLAKLLCENILLFAGGFGTNQLNTSIIPVILGHFPAGTATKVILHYSQLMKNGRFCKYDYGVTKNFELYGAAEPPPYKLENVKIPVALIYSAHDALAPRTDVTALYKDLPNVIGNYRVPLTQFNHLDFLWGTDVKALVYDQVVEIFKQTSTKLNEI